MKKGSIIALVVIVILAALGGAAYYYNPGLLMMQHAEPLAEPDSSVLAGPIKAVTATSITIQKQSAGAITLTIASSTSIKEAAVNGGVADDAASTALQIGTMVLITPDLNDASLAQSIIILPEPTP